MLLRRQEKSVTRATGWFCWQCWAWEKGKLYLMGWGYRRKKGFGSLCWGGLTFCSGTELLQPEPSICRALAKLHYWPNSSQCTHTHTHSKTHLPCRDTRHGGKRHRTWRGMDRKPQRPRETESNQSADLSFPPLHNLPIVESARPLVAL